MLEDFRLKVFLTVASERSFTKAADILRVSQPAISQNVSELEKGLGVRLFRRLRSETILTPEGEVFARYADRILSAALQTELMFSDLDRSGIRIAASAEIFDGFVLPALKDFMTVHPEISVERSSTDDCDILVTVVPSSVNGKSSFEVFYKPTQAFAFTKTCAVLKNILGF